MPRSSVYLDLETGRLSTSLARDEQLRSLTGNPELDRARNDIEHIRELLARDAALADGARG